jgi:glycosyltransferase involved in cell wall biosynthesis
MKLLVLSPWCPYPPDNGAKQRVYYLIEQLAARHDITLLTFAPGAADAPMDPALAGLCRSVHPVAADAFGAPQGVRGLFSVAPRSYAQNFNAEMASLVRRLAPAHEALVIEDVAMGVYVPFARDVPVIVDRIEVAVIRDRVTRERRPLAKGRRWLTWRKLGRFIRWLARHSVAITTPSGEEFDSLVKLGCDPGHVVVIPNGVPSTLLGTVAPRETESLIFAGSITYEANLDAVRYFAREIWPLIRAVRPNARMIVTGGTGRVALGDLAETPGLTFVGREADVRRRVASSAACVVPLRIGAGTRIKILEALAVGTPVVTTTKGAEGLAVRDGSEVLVADTPRAFADQVLRLLAAPDLAARLTGAGRALVAREYTWDVIAPRFEAVLSRAGRRKGVAAGSDPRAHHLSY